MMRNRLPGRAPGEWRVALFQSGVIAALVIGALLLAGTAGAATSTIGRTWPIAEPDALAEIEARAGRLPPNMAGQFGPRRSWSALRPASLGVARKSQVRSVVPFYTLDFDVSLPGGRILYPKGYTFNPLAFVKLPQRLVIVHAGDLGWAARAASLTDWILLTSDPKGAGAPNDDALSLGTRLGRPVFILEERVKARLGLTVAPVIVRQVGQRLELTEVQLDRKPARKAAP